MIYNNGKFILAIGFILSIVFIGWYLKKKKKKKISWKSLTYSGHMFFVGVIIYVLYALCYYTVANYYPNREFKKEDWLGNIEERYELCNDLVKKKKDLLLDRSESEIIDQLGLPLYRNDSTIHYYLGITPSFFAIDPELLVIQLNENGECINFYRKRQS